MTAKFNLTHRISLLIAGPICLAVAIAKASEILCVSWPQAIGGALVLSVTMCRAISQLRASVWHDLQEALLDNERAGKFTPNFPEDSPMTEVNRLSAVLNRAARSVEKSRAELDGAYLQFVETMAQALDARDPYTAGHSLRVAEYSHQVAKAMGLSDEEAGTIRVAAQLHDIGKIGIPDAVLQKPGRLTPEEYGLIKLHPQIGRKILEKVGLFESLLPVVELHHENYDGSGYPYGLVGQDVPLEARIVHVADSFDAMTTTRSYRSALSLRAAILEIERNAGRQFDPFVAKVFLGLIAEGAIEVGGLKISAQMETDSNVTRERLAV
jgi:putative nucleotidyltransferase with HDIG domain